MHPATTAVAAGRPTGTGAPLNHPVVLASNFRGEEGEYARTHGRKKVTVVSGTSATEPALSSSSKAPALSSAAAN